MNTLPDHLGGHKNRTHLDHGVLEYMIKEYNINSMLDIGCGPGGMVQLAREMNLNAFGIDGDFTIDRKGNYFYIHDYSVNRSNVNQTVDFAWSCEFLEHVDEEYIPNYMPDFQKAKYVVMTFSEKPGHHHVNLKPAEYWINVFDSYGFTHDKEVTSKIRNASTMNTTGKFTKKQFVKTNGLFFVKR
jgi:hypothetical protein|tara:strand:- start:1057 stop:1614 length:558 start_codon:yes stop_codon:yes gene_type:complete